jgi:hypothetical protein
MDRPGLHSGPSLERIPLPVVLVDTTKVRTCQFPFLFFPDKNNLLISPFRCYAQRDVGGLLVHQEAQWRLEEVLVCTSPVYI